MDLPGVVDDPVSMPGVALAEEEWTRDPHGQGPSLAGKRARRNPWKRWQGVFTEETDYKSSGLQTIRGAQGCEVLDPIAPKPFA